jgi:hypothetical protein
MEHWILQDRRYKEYIQNSKQNKSHDIWLQVRLSSLITPLFSKSTYNAIKGSIILPPASYYKKKIVFKIYRIFDVFDLYFSYDKN